MAFWNKKEKELSQGEKTRKMIVQLVLRVVILFMLFVTLIYGIFSIISGSSLFIPKDAKGVLDKVDQNNSYAWRVEMVRRAKLPGIEIPEQQRLTGAVINKSKNNFQAGVKGVFPLDTFYNSDGEYTLQLIEGSEEFQIITDVCEGAPAIPVKTLEMPTAKMIEESNPSLKSDEETFFGERAWLLEIEKPSPELMDQLFWIKFLDEVSLNPGLEKWVLSEKERELIDSGQYTLERSRILVTYESPYQIAQIDLNVKIGYAKYRILAQLVPTEGGELLENKDLGPADC